MPAQADDQLHEPQATQKPLPAWLSLMFFLIPGIALGTSLLPQLPQQVLAEVLLFGLISWAAWKTPRTLARTLLFGANALTVLAFVADQLWLGWGWLSLYAPSASMVLGLAALLDLVRAYRIGQQNVNVL